MLTRCYWTYKESQRCQLFAGADITEGTHKIALLGIPKLGVPSLDPFSVPRVDLLDNGKTATLTSCKLTGGASAVVSNFSSVIDSGIGYSIALPTFELKCSYSMAAGFLGAAKQNSGNAAISMKNYRSWFHHTGSLRISCAKVYAQWDSAATNVLGGDSFHATFDGLGKQTLDQNKLRSIAFTAFQSTQAKLLNTYLQTLFSNFPTYATWLPPNSVSNRVPYCIAGKPSC